MRAAMSVDPLPAAAGDAEALAVLARDADPGGLAVLGVEDGHVGHVDRPLLLDDAALLAHLVGPLVALDDVQALDEDLLLGRVDAEHAARLALVLAGDDEHLVVAPDLHGA